ncbi:CGNR zinc finger domain-containing protein [Paraburkholderia flagellata]|uniref:CGNR zinc finger domain-containing protein n=1 Tax=Paraburkholderia flagellata TaxID=2883241 RepID=UPI00357102E7
MIVLRLSNLSSLRLTVTVTTVFGESHMASLLPMVPVHDLIVEFLNTVLSEDGRHEDLLESDEGVMLWFEKQGLTGIGVVDCTRVRGLAYEAKALREVVRHLLNQRKSGEAVDVNRLNRFLHAASYSVELMDSGEGALKSVRRYACTSTTQAVAPIALAAADLLANGDFRLLGKCEGDHCAMWFYDRTRAHRRRWCNMAICGNRQKIARFRSKLKG